MKISHTISSYFKIKTFQKYKLQAPRGPRSMSFTEPGPGWCGSEANACFRSFK